LLQLNMSQHFTMIQLLFWFSFGFILLEKPQKVIIKQFFSPITFLVHFHTKVSTVYT
jgi:hypothetical protein